MGFNLYKWKSKTNFVKTSKVKKPNDPISVFMTIFAPISYATYHTEGISGGYLLSAAGIVTLTALLSVVKVSYFDFQQAERRVCDCFGGVVAHN